MTAAASTRSLASKPGQDVVPDGNCSFGTAEDERELNVGLRLAPGGDGICDEANPEAACYIPLNHSDTSGWREETANGVRTIFLPKAVCTKLDAGEVQAVRLTAACPTKTDGRATCGPWTQQDEPSEPVPGPPIMVVDAGSEGGASGGGEGGGGGDGSLVGSGGTGATGGTGNTDTGGTDSSTGGTTSIAGTASDGGSLSGVGGSTGSGGSGVVVGGTGSDFGGNIGVGGQVAQAGAGSEGGFGGFGASGGFGGTSATGGFAGDAAVGGTGPGVTDCANGPLLFADAQLEARLREVLELPTGPIMPVHVAGLTNLVMSNRGITALDGLECLRDLQLLDLATNNVSDLWPLGKLSELSELDLTGNQVSNLAQLMPVTSLTQLKLAANDVVDLSPLVGNPGIGAGDLVDVTGNLIDCETQGFNISQLESRNVILASDCNQVTDCINGPLTFVDPAVEQAVRNAVLKPVGAIMPADVAQLTSLAAFNKGVTDLSGVECLTALEQMLLKSNQLVDLSPLSALGKLYSLDASDNAIVDVSPLAALLELQSVTLADNLLSDLSPLLLNPGLDNGDYLNITANPLNCAREHSTITQLGARGILVQSDCVYSPTNCAQGPLTFVDPNLEEAVRISTGVMTGDIMPGDVSALTFLSTGSEGGMDVYSLEGMQCLTQLRNVTLADNLIEDLSPLVALSQLQTLDVSGNFISDLTPLVAGSGLGEGDVLDATSNPANCENQNDNLLALQNRSVEVYLDCPIGQ